VLSVSSVVKPVFYFVAGNQSKGTDYNSDKQDLYPSISTFLPQRTQRAQRKRARKKALTSKINTKKNVSNMPIYEFYCDQCNVIFNFLSSRVNTSKIPDCPRCGKPELTKQISTFATIGKAKEESDNPLDGFDESKMEHAFESLMKESENVNEDDPRQMASLMRKFTSQTGMQLGDSMEEAISRMESGEDPEQVEREMGDQISEDDFSLDSMKKKVARQRKAPVYDEKLYDL
jgi:putative FmdB family regulatory protein